MFLICLFILGSVSALYHSKHGRCVHLESGAALGHEALFDLGRPYFIPIAVPKLGDGTPIVRDKLWSIKVSATTIHGVAMEPVHERGYRFAWRADAGLVLENADPAGYEQLVAEAGPSNEGVGPNNVGTEWLMKELAKRPGFEAVRCPTAWVTW